MRDPIPSYASHLLPILFFVSHLQFSLSVKQSFNSSSVKRADWSDILFLDVESRLFFCVWRWKMTTRGDEKEELHKINW